MMDATLVSRIRRLVSDQIRSSAPTATGRVSAVSATTPPTVTVGGKRLRYLASYTTPAVGDEVVVTSGPSPLVLGKLA